MEEEGSKEKASHREEIILRTSELPESGFLLSRVIRLTLVSEKVLFSLTFGGKLFLVCWGYFPCSKRIMKSLSRVNSLVAFT